MKKELMGGFAWAGAMLALTVGAIAANKLGYIDRETVTRLTMGAIGLMVAWYGNRIPKTFTRSASARQVQRVAGWSQVLSGLVYAGLWAFAAIQTATWCGTAAILAGVAITFGYCLTQPRKAKAA